MHKEHRQKEMFLEAIKPAVKLRLSQLPKNPVFSDDLHIINNYEALLEDAAGMARIAKIAKRFQSDPLIWQQKFFARRNEALVEFRNIFTEEGEIDVHAIEINYLTEIGEIDQAMKHLEEVQNKFLVSQLSRVSALATSIATNLLKMGYVEHAQMIMNRIEKVSVDPEPWIPYYTYLFKVLESKQDSEELYDLLKKIEKQDLLSGGDYHDKYQLLISTGLQHLAYTHIKMDSLSNAMSYADQIREPSIRIDTFIKILEILVENFENRKQDLLDFVTFMWLDLDQSSNNNTEYLEPEYDMFSRSIGLIKIANILSKVPGFEEQVEKCLT